MLTLNNDGWSMLLTLVVGQACPVCSFKVTTRMVTHQLQSGRGDSWALFFSSFVRFWSSFRLALALRRAPLIFTTPCQADLFCALTHQSSAKPHRVTLHRFVPATFLPSNGPTQPTGAQTNSCFGRCVSGIQEMWSRKRSRHIDSTTDSLC